MGRSKVGPGRNIDHLSYKCEGYEYEPWEDREEDNIKIWHDIRTPGGEVIHGPWSPYKVPTLEQFSEFVSDYVNKRTLDILALNRRHYG